MTEILPILQSLWGNYIRHFLDIFVSAFVIYKLFTLIRGTRSVQVLRGIIFLLVATLFAEVLDFVLIGWMVRWIWVAGAVALVIVFQPEIRSFLAHLGSGRLTRIIMRGKVEFIEEVMESLKNISRRGNGALIVLEQETGLKDYVETGITLNAEITSELLETIFTPPAPLHDGAVILSADRLVAAGCILPLTHNTRLSKVMGTRHRAGVGLTEVSDAIVIIVSQETGNYSMAQEGSLKKDMEIEEIKEELLDYYREKVADEPVQMD